ncbi:beta-1,4-galactosyltransferase 1-like [Mixophyes fleayi]|uniref:beta-1,4-galactosyltransferase 1-like n=1 Tax=Mixophyes fleayi TaxID=3061075 RepID=UPI003F4E22DC
MAQQMASVGTQGNDEEVVMAMLQNLTPESDFLVETLKSSDTNLVTEIVRAKLLQFQQRIPIKTNAGSFALFTKSIKSKKPKYKCFVCHNMEHKASECRPRDSSGPRVVDLRKNVSFLNITLENPDVQNGGRSKPQICRAQQKIAIIIPFRNREPHLKIWLYHMHPFLQKQQGDYGIYVVEQIENTIFNRAKLMNVGFAEAVKDNNYTCFIFSDVDIIPIDERNLYRCSKNPKHMANSVDKFSYSLPYSTLFGGVVAFTKEQFLKINGFSNRFWGWGGEDDELYNRVVSAGMKVERPNQNIARSRMIVHTRDVGNERTGKSSHLIYKAAQHMYTDGLNSLKYDIIRNTKHQLYTKITVDIGSSDKMKKAFYFFNAFISD